MIKAIQVVDFQQDSGEHETRRLSDLSGRVLQDDPHHESTVFFKGSAGNILAGT